MKNKGDNDMDLTNMREEIQWCLYAYVSMIETYNSLLEKICRPGILYEQADG